MVKLAALEMGVETLSAAFRYQTMAVIQKPQRFLARAYALIVRMSRISLKALESVALSNFVVALLTKNALALSASVRKLTTPTTIASTWSGIRTIDARNCVKMCLAPVVWSLARMGSRFLSRRTASLSLRWSLEKGYRP